MSDAPAIRVIVVEDHAAIREDLEVMVDAEPGIVCAGAFASTEEFLACELDAVDVVLMDIGLPQMSGIEAIGPTRARWPEADVLMLTVHFDDDHVFGAICAGAMGYLLKSTAPRDILEAIRQVHAGGAPTTPSIARKIMAHMHQVPPELGTLSDREREVLEQMIDGNTNAQIADRLFVSVNTIAFHVKQIYGKLHVHSRAEAVARAMGRRYQA